MEEILASIRRIISEDEAASSKNRAPTGPTAPASESAITQHSNASSPTIRPEGSETHQGNQPANGAGGTAVHATELPTYGDPGGQYAETAQHYEASVNTTGATPFPMETQRYDANDQGYAPDGAYDPAGGGPAAYDDPSVLDLTEMVAEDGSVVTIAPVSADVAADGYADAAVYDEQGGYGDTLYSDQNAYDYDQQQGYGDPVHSYPANIPAPEDGDQGGAGGQAATPISSDGQAHGGPADTGWTANAGPGSAGGAAEFPPPDNPQNYDDAGDHDPIHDTPGHPSAGYAPAVSDASPPPDGNAAVLRQGPRDEESAGSATEPPTTKPANTRRLNSALAALAGGDADEKNAPDSGDPPTIAKKDDPKTRATAPDAKESAPKTVRPANRDVRVVASTTPATPAEPAKATVAPDNSKDVVAMDTATAQAAADLMQSPALEGMVREAMKPMLQEWLDKNLSRLVEDVARQELSRMIERRGGL